MSDLVAQGKVLHYGVSEEWGSARLEEAQRIIDRYNLYPITVVQPQYNLQDRYIEHEIMGTCRKLGIGITTFSPTRAGSADRQGIARASRCRPVLASRGLTNLRLPPTGAIVKRRNRYRLGPRPGRWRFRRFCCLLNDLVVSGQGRERHELGGPLVTRHMRMLA